MDENIKEYNNNDDTSEPNVVKDNVNKNSDVQDFLINQIILTKFANLLEKNAESLRNDFSISIGIIAENLDNLNVKYENLQSFVENNNTNSDNNKFYTPSSRNRVPNFGDSTQNFDGLPKTPNAALLNAKRRESIVSNIFNDFNNINTNAVQILSTPQSFDHIKITEFSVKGVLDFLYEVKLFKAKFPSQASSFPKLVTFVNKTTPVGRQIYTRILAKAKDSQLTEFGLLNCTDKQFTEYLLKAITPQNIFEFQNALKDNVTFHLDPQYDKYRPGIQSFEKFYHNINDYIRDFINVYDYITKYLDTNKVKIRCDNKNTNNNPGIIKLFLDPIPHEFGQNLYNSEIDNHTYNFKNLKEFLSVFEFLLNEHYNIYEQVKDKNIYFKKSGDTSSRTASTSEVKTPSPLVHKHFTPGNHYVNRNNNFDKKYSSNNNNNFSRGNNRVSAIEEDHYYNSDINTNETDFNYDEVQSPDSDQTSLIKTIDDLNQVTNNYKDWKESAPETKGCLHKLLYKECKKPNCKFNHSDPKVLSNTCHSLIKSLSESTYNNMYTLIMKNVNSTFKKEASSLRFNNIVDTTNNTTKTTILKRSNDEPITETYIFSDDHLDY